MISIRVKDCWRLRRCSAVRCCSWIGAVHSFYVAKYILTGMEFMPSFFMKVAWHLTHSDRKKWLQNICSVLRWILTAGSDVLHFWPCEMLSCLCNASHIKCTNCREGSSCLHKDIFLKTNVVQVSFTNAIFLLLFHDMGSAWCIFLYFKCGTGKS